MPMALAAPVNIQTNRKLNFVRGCLHAYIDSQNLVPSFIQTKSASGYAYVLTGNAATCKNITKNGPVSDRIARRWRHLSRTQTPLFLLYSQDMTFDDTPGKRIN